MIALIVMLIAVLYHRLILVRTSFDMVGLVVLMRDVAVFEISEGIELRSAEIPSSEQPRPSIVTVARKVRPTGFIAAYQRGDVALPCHCFAGKQHDHVQPRWINAVRRVIVAVGIQVRRSSFSGWIVAKPAAEIGIIRAIECQVKIARGMVVMTGETEIGVQHAADFGSTSVGIVVVPSLDNAAAISELANAA